MLRNWSWAPRDLQYIGLKIYSAGQEVDKSIPDLEVPFNRVRKRLMLPGDLLASLVPSSSGSQVPSLIFCVEMLFLPNLKKRFSELVFVPVRFCSVVGMFSGSASGTSWRLDIVRWLKFFKNFFLLIFFPLTYEITMCLVKWILVCPDKQTWHGTQSLPCWKIVSLSVSLMLLAFENLYVWQLAAADFKSPPNNMC